MIIIISFSSDFSTTSVIRELVLSGSNIIRLDVDNISDFRIFKEKEEWCISFKKLKCKIDDITKVWLRKGGFDNGGIPSDSFPHQESLSMYYFFLEIVREKLVGSLDFLSQRKLSYLQKARDFEIQVPEYNIIDTKSVLSEFLKTSKNGLIYKSMSQCMFPLPNNEFYYCYTTKLEEKELEQWPDKFYPTFFQFNIDSLAELRTFYIDGDFYASAISQTGTEKKEVDIRKDLRRQRIFPFEINSSLRMKLTKLLKTLSLDICAFDMLLCKATNELFLIDINPTGQYEYYSKKCNYNLNTKIAQYLSKPIQGI